MEAFARLLLLLVAAAFLWNLARGTHRAWLRAKFLGERPTKVGARFGAGVRGTLKGVGEAIEKAGQAAEGASSEEPDVRLAGTGVLV